MYVIRNKRLKNFLYALGLEYKIQEDKTGRTDYVYLQNQKNYLKQLHFTQSLETSKKNNPPLLWGSKILHTENRPPFLWGATEV
ncbi:hypothetical protein [Clostridium cochlearium]|uniref:hypothetical protein n=1 Tax=Clostridium cochlearium TaxID=1494 RepID=UPI000BBC8EE3|nr:hypothetical protein [Clostridium cochlearium]